MSRAWEMLEDENDPRATVLQQMHMLPPRLFQQQLQGVMTTGWQILESRFLEFVELPAMFMRCL